MSEPRESGAALIESLLLGLVLLVPVMLSLTLMGDLQAGAFATSAAVREAGADAARASTIQDADAAVAEAVALALSDHGLKPGLARVEWSGSLKRGGAVEVLVHYPVDVFQMPFLGDVGGPRIWIRARHIARIDPFGSRAD